VDEDEVEVPPAGLPEEEWETGDELPSLAPEEPQRWPGSALQPSEASEAEAEPEAASEEEWAAAGWEVFPQPGEPLPRGTGALPRGREPLTTEPEEAVDEGLEAAGWETFPEPGRRPPRWPEEEAGRKPASPSESEPSLPGPGDPVLPGPYPARAGAGAAPTMEIPPVDVFDFERQARRQGPISEEVLSGAVTMEHRGLAEEVAAADTAETLALRVLDTEHRLYPHALALVASGAVRIEGERVVATGAEPEQSALFLPPFLERFDPNH
jgi:hypothetical protein